MKRLTAAVVAASVTAATAAPAMDTDRFRAIVAETIGMIGEDPVDLPRAIALQRELIGIGVEGARAFGAESPEDAALMTLVADNAEAMTAMSLDEIEEAWHDGAALSEIGLDFDSLDHFGPAVSHMDAVVHPATAIIALHAFEETGDRSYLLQVRDELSEVVEHIGHLD